MDLDPTPPSIFGFGYLKVTLNDGKWGSLGYSYHQRMYSYKHHLQLTLIIILTNSTLVVQR